MKRKVTLFTGQWADLSFEEMCKKASSFGYEGLEIACIGDHFDIEQATAQYCNDKLSTLEKYGLKAYSLSIHLVGQAVCDNIDSRHKSILPATIWGDGEPEGVRKRAAETVKKVADACVKMGINVVTGFTGSSIWHLLYSFPPVDSEMIDEGYNDFATRWTPIMDYYQQLGVKFALEVHPTEIAFDIASAQRALEAIDYHPAFGFNFDPSHFAYQGVDYIKFIDKFADRIYHVHMKDVWWSDTPCEAGVFGGHTNFGDPRRFWEFRSLGRGKVKFEEIIRALNRSNYRENLSVEWEDSYMDREQGAKEACDFVKSIDFIPSRIAFDAAFDNKNQCK
ncbi:MAG: sugar phosphate isomerase/epimerase [Rikenellaceae bacterium]